MPQSPTFPMDARSNPINAKPVSPDSPVIAFIADNVYAMPLAAAISSIAANLDKRRTADVFILDAGLSPNQKRKIAESQDPGRIRIQWLKPSARQIEILRSLPSSYTDRSTYYKIFIPELLSDYSRIVYLDCDVIVDADISDLWAADLGGNYLLAAQDQVNPFVSSPLGLRNWRELSRNAEDEYFNAGVLVLNATRWRQENVAYRLVQYLRENYASIRLCEQDAMNAVFRNEWGRLDLRWNVLPYMKAGEGRSLFDKKSHEKIMGVAWILHFCGPNKPWRRRCTHARKDRFFHYLDRTAWSGWRPKWWMINGKAFLHGVSRTLSRLPGRRAPRKQRMV